MLLFKTQSKVNYANSSKSSLKINIPAHVNDVLRLSPKDVVEWIVELDEDQQIKVSIRKVE